MVVAVLVIVMHMGDLQTVTDGTKRGTLVKGRGVCMAEVPADAEAFVEKLRAVNIIEE